MYDKSKGLAIGIDFGTTDSSVGVWRNNKLEIISNDLGSKTTPSCVAFVDDQILIGEPAKMQAIKNPANTIFNVKRFLGMRYSDPKIQKDRPFLSFKIQAGEDDSILIHALRKGTNRKFTPEEIAGLIIRKMKHVAEAFLGEKVLNAVISVPAYFTDNQRQSLKIASSYAELNVLRFINDTDSVAMAEGFDKITQKELKTLIIDIGGGKIEIAQIVLDNGVLQNKLVSGNTHIGGVDFDHKIMEYCQDQFWKKYGIYLESNSKSLTKLRGEAQNAKKMLTISAQTTIKIESLTNSHDFSLTLTKAKFEEISQNVFQQMTKYFRKILKNIKKHQIKYIFLSGKATSIPKITQIIKETFEIQPIRCINFGEAVTCGCAMQSSILTGVGKEILNCMLLLSTASLSLGVEVAGGLMKPIIFENTPIPAMKSLMFTTNVDGQFQALIQLYQGNRLETKNNNFLGQFTINVQPTSKGVIRLEISILIDQNRNITITAEEIKTRRTAKYVVVQKDRFLKQNKKRSDNLQKKKKQASNQIFVNMFLKKPQVPKISNEIVYVPEEKQFLQKELENHTFEDELKIIRSKRSFQNYIKNLKEKIAESEKWLQKSNETELKTFDDKLKTFENTIKKVKFE